MKRNDIEKAYCILKQIAIKSYKNRKYDECLKQLCEATILPIQFNWQYKDDDIEEIMQNISYEVIHKVEEENYTSNSNKYVFIDDFCRSFILTLQYLEAFNKKI
jgi:hypothetical protein